MERSSRNIHHDNKNSAAKVIHVSFENLLQSRRISTQPFSLVKFNPVQQSPHVHFYFFVLPTIDYQDQKLHNSNQRGQLLFPLILVSEFPIFFRQRKTTKSFYSSWRRAADSCAACRGCAEAEVPRTRPSNESIVVEGEHKRAPSWRGPQARRMASSLFQSAQALRPRPPRRMRANHPREIAIGWSCWVARGLAKLPLQHGNVNPLFSYLSCFLSGSFPCLFIRNTRGGGKLSIIINYYRVIQYLCRYTIICLFC